MRVLALTSIRSEYDLLSGLFFKLDADPDIDLRLIVGGAHNSPSFGLSCTQIEHDGLSILTSVESLLDADSASSRLKSASILLISIIDMVKGFSPDLIIYAGDREEVMVGALLGGYLDIPSVHFFGGDHAADGHIDNPLRHAVSKLSTCHFVSTEEHRKRLMALAEPKERIFNIGSVALDKFTATPVLPNIAEKISGKKISGPHVVLIYHPILDEVDRSESILSSIVHGLVEEGFHVFAGKPNSDHGNIGIRHALEKMDRELDSLTLYGNLGREEFISLFKTSSLIVGNSSAGLLEAPTLKVPTLNVGMRQRGRMAASSVLFVEANHEDIIEGVRKVLSPDFRKKLVEVINPYGDGKSVEKAYDLIKSIDFKAILKKKEDPLNANEL